MPSPGPSPAPVPVPDRPPAPIGLDALARLADLIPDAAVVVDDGGVIVLANAHVEAVFGYAAGELAGEPVDRLIPQRFHARHRGHRADYVASPRTRPMGSGRLDLRGVRKDGSEFPADISLSTVASDRGELSIAAIRDVTDRVRTERRRRELEERLAVERALAQASRMESVGQLAGGIAHDFNNLLSVILGNLGFVMERLPAGSLELDELEQVRRAAEQAAGLTRQLLTFSRREVVDPVPVDVNGVVGDVERLLRRTLGEQVHLRTRLHRPLPAVRADPGGIEQVLVNLAVNARDAMPDGGRLDVSTTLVEVEAAEAARRPPMAPGPHVRVTVADSGEGMDEAVMRRALEPFFTTKAKERGTGLGLATVHAIVTQAGGSLLLRSTPGAGTQVHVDLPVADTGAAAGADPAEAPAAPAGGHVLVVEDEPAVRDVAARILRRGGFDVTAAGGGEEALRLLRDDRQAVDVLLSDVVMPTMAGPQLVTAARELRPALGVVLMSGYVDPDIDLDGLAGVMIIQKPFSADTLLTAVRRTLAPPS